MQFIWLPDLQSSFLWLYLLNGRTVISQLLLKSGKISDSLRLKSIIYLTDRTFHFHSFSLLFLPYFLYWILWSLYVFTSLSPSAVWALLEVTQELACVFVGFSEHSYNRPLDELHVLGSTDVTLWEGRDCGTGHFQRHPFTSELHVSLVFAWNFVPLVLVFWLIFFFSYFNPFSGSVAIFKSCLAVLGWGAISLI